MPKSAIGWRSDHQLIMHRAELDQSRTGNGATDSNKCSPYVNILLPVIPPCSRCEEEDRQNTKQKANIGRYWLRPSQDCGERDMRPIVSPAIVFRIAHSELW